MSRKENVMDGIANAIFSFFLPVLIVLWTGFIIVFVKLLSRMKKKSPVRVGFLFASIHVVIMIVSFLLYLLTQNDGLRIATLFFYGCLDFPVGIIYSIFNRADVFHCIPIKIWKCSPYSDFDLFLVFGSIQYFVIGLLVGYLVTKRPKLIDKLLEPIKKQKSKE
jgi:hypothetical protein